MKILVFGGTNFFGRRLVELLKKDHEVTIVTRGNQPIPAGVHSIKGDRKDLASLENALGSQTFDLAYDQIGYVEAEAKTLIELLKDRCPRLVFTSSASVYGEIGGRSVSEKVVNPYLHEVTVGHKVEYAQGKIDCESTYLKHSPFQVVCVRFPFVLGLDDYTKRMHWHKKRIAGRLPLYAPNPQAIVPYVHAAEAAEFLKFIGLHPRFTGPINACSTNLLTLESVFSLISKVVGHEPILQEQFSQKDHSPYGIKKDVELNVTLARELGFRFSDLMSWLPKLLTDL